MNPFLWIVWGVVLVFVVLTVAVVISIVVASTVETIREKRMEKKTGMVLSDQDTPAQMVSEFHLVFGLPARFIPETPHPNEQYFRMTLLREEWEEYMLAVVNEDLVEVADALADMVYVIYGTALHYGIDLDAVIAEVHRSNMTKTPTPNGGKAIKGPNYERPDIQRVLNEGF